MSNLTCFLDMDGVLANFVEGACNTHYRSWPYTDINNLGKFDIEKIWGMTPAEFWAPIDKRGLNFWSDLKKMPDADAIVTLVVKKFGINNIAILTSPSDDPSCIPGKKEWIKRYYPKLYRKIIFGGAKGLLASYNKVLIDDRDKNIDEFRDGGGLSILVPRPWNRLHDLKSKTAIEWIKEGIEIYEQESKLLLTRSTSY
jgi:5'(3')-deoxyribonucleotidase